MSTLDLSRATDISPLPAPIDDVSGAHGLPRGLHGVAGATLVTPETAPVEPMAEIARAGVELTKWVFVLIAAFLVFGLSVVTIGEYRGLTRSREYGDALVSSIVARRAVAGSVDSVATSVRDTALNRKRLELARADSMTAHALMTAIEVEQASARQFWLSLFQLVLLNVLLPVLTALLGYVFGRSS